jgi:hypothetical protein
MATFHLRFPRTLHETKQFDISFDGNKLSQKRKSRCPYLVETRAYGTGEMIRDLRPWFIANVTGQWCYRSIFLDNRTKWYFEKLTDATLFKLTFGSL